MYITHVETITNLFAMFDISILIAMPLAFILVGMICYKTLNVTDVVENHVYFN